MLTKPNMGHTVDPKKIEEQFSQHTFHNEYCSDYSYEQKSERQFLHPFRIG